NQSEEWLAARLAADKSGARTALWVPLLKDGAVVGACVLSRDEVRPFGDKEIALVENFAKQAVIAIENARLLTELRESLDRQTATADILRAIASTPGDPTRALDTIAETAVRMFDAANVGIRRLEGDMLHMIASAGPTTGALRGRTPARSIDSPDFFARAARENRQFLVPDMQAEIAKWPPDLQETLRQGGVRTAAFTPLTRDGKAIGAMGVNRTELRPFRPDELQLMTSFADQAVIAIENARLLIELRESLEQQQAIAEVLQVINGSPGDLTPVFEAMVEKARRLCNADSGHLALPVDNDFRTMAVSAMSPEMEAVIRAVSYAPGRGTAVGRALMERQAIQIADIGADPEHAARHVASQDMIRTILGVPLLREGMPIGAFGLSRTRVEPFTERQIDLVRTFAAQAVIAMDNARLLGELRESLEQQQAMAEVLQAINASPGNLAPVFEAILEKAHTLCGASRGAL
ncbi:MAG: GAF domain-containing protein, partial [Stellaceae bacterium]